MKESQLQSMLPRLREVFSRARFVILHGSVAAGVMRDESDVDLAVMYAAPLGPGEVLRLVAELSGVFGREVDLLDLHRAGPIVKMQVLRHGRPLIVNDRAAFERFRMYTPSEYFDFKLLRRAAEKAILGGSLP